MSSWVIRRARAAGLVPQHVRDRARGARGGHRLGRGRPLRGPARLRPAAARALAAAHRRRAGLPGRSRRGGLRHGGRVERSPARGELPEAVMAFLREQGFFGLVIPKEYGGKAFSALGVQRHPRQADLALAGPLLRRAHPQLRRTGRAPGPLRHARRRSVTTCHASRAARRSPASPSPSPRPAPTPPPCAPWARSSGAPTAGSCCASTSRSATSPSLPSPPSSAWP